MNNFHRCLALLSGVFGRKCIEFTCLFLQGQSARIGSICQFISLSPATHREPKFRSQSTSEGLIPEFMCLLSKGQSAHIGNTLEFISLSCQLHIGNQSSGLSELQTG